MPDKWNKLWFVSHAAGTGWVEVSWTFGVQLLYGNLKIIFTDSNMNTPHPQEVT